MLDDLHGKIALVTGASRGIGRAIAIALARAGVDVAVNYRANRDDAESAAAEVRQAGRRALAIQADVSNAAEVHGLVDGVHSQLGEIDILVNNAGIARVQKIGDVTEQDWDEL